MLNHESPEFIRFVNPGDLRIAHISCGTSGCHDRSVLEVRKSMMTHGCMLWGAALYNNGASPSKWSLYGESYSMHGAPQRMQTVPPPTPHEIAFKGVLPYLDPLPRFQVTQPGNVLRIFERGGRFLPEVGIPERLEEPGRPRTRVSNRGLGTNNRTDPVFIGLQKTRLFDPTLNFLGTNDHPGDYRSSGCTSCHVVYANDRSPVNSGPYAKYGNMGLAAAEVDALTPEQIAAGGAVQAVDPCIRKDQPGHPIAHQFTSGVPSSQCMVCHTHPGTTVMNSFLGYMWWDLETDGDVMYPHEERKISPEDFVEGQMNNPNESSIRGLWSDPAFLADVAKLNPVLEQTWFADFHGHGWNYRAVFRKDLFGREVDKHGKVLDSFTAADRAAAVRKPLEARRMYREEMDLDTVRRLENEFESAWSDVPVHLLDVHLERGMHCVDCHFIQDMHGNGKLYGEVRAAIEITCKDCHGNATGRAYELVDGVLNKPKPGERPKLFTSGPAATERVDAPDGRDLTAMGTPSGEPRFELRDGRIVQHSMVEPGLAWEITQVVDTIDPEHAEYNPRSALAKTVRWEDGPEGPEMAWGDVPEDWTKCAHDTGSMSCISCHSSWNPSCYGCHLPQKANIKTPDLHNEGDVTRNYVSYNFQTLRDDVFMLAHDGNVTGRRINPSRSSCAIHVSSYNGNRENIYIQQQTISAEGMSGIAFSTNVPHTVRGKGETKNCTACHISQANDNNAVVTQLMMLGTNWLNHIGRYVWTANGEHGLFGVIATERDEPQTVIGSTMHETVFPEQFHEHVEAGGLLEEGHEHPGWDVKDQLLHPFKKPDIKMVQPRGEYLYAACGHDGIRFFDIAFIDHKGFSERITTAPFSPLGQKFHVESEDCTFVAVPTTIAPDPTREHYPENYEQEVDDLYAYVYCTDRCEGLILVNIATLIDGDPLNNFVERALTFNPGGLLNGAESCTIFGNYCYVCCEKGIVTLDMSDPLKPVVCRVADCVDHPRNIEFQLRYAFATDRNGLTIFDVTDMSHPRMVSRVPLADARRVYVARNYAYVAAGKQGLVIVDVLNPERPKVAQVFNAGGCIDDAHDVKLGITYASEFAYVADGHNGLRVVQLTSPETPGYDGFFPTPAPRLIGTFPAEEGECLYVGEGIDRDRAVDEAGQQIAVLGRVGARPLNLAEQERIFLKPGLPRERESVFRVIDGTRDWSIRNVRDREAELHFDLESYYGPSRHPSLGPVIDRPRRTPVPRTGPGEIGVPPAPAAAE